MCHPRKRGIDSGSARLGAWVVREFFGESGLSHPATEQSEQLTGAVCLGTLDALAQHRQLRSRPTSRARIVVSK